MDWTIILTIVFTGLAAILAAISPFFIAWLLKQKWVQQLHLENLISAVIPQVVEWVEWWATHWKDPATAPKGEAKMDKALELLKTYVPAATKIPDEILKLKLETALSKLKEA
jgi:hypothetical protein